MPKTVDNVAAKRRLILQALVLQALYDAYNGPMHKRQERIEEVRRLLGEYERS